MVVVNNVLLGRYWPCVGPQEMLFTCMLRRVAEGNGGGEQRAAGPLLALSGDPRNLYLLHCAGWQKGMVVVNNVLLGRYWPRVGPQETLFLPGTLFQSAPHINNITIIEQENTWNKHLQ
jgi:hypothetical protein